MTMAKNTFILAFVMPKQVCAVYVSSFRLCW